MKRKLSINEYLIYIVFLLGTVAFLIALTMYLHNRTEDRNAALAVDSVMKQIHTKVSEDLNLNLASAANLPFHTEKTGIDSYLADYVLNADREMPSIEIDGNRYIGYLSFPTLDLELPVMSSWSYTNLKTAPCLYTGSIYKGNAVIAAHNYSSHFGKLNDLKPGDSVSFTDVDGDSFPFEIVTQDVLAPTAIEEMTTSDFDLSLFTCTYGGTARLTIRCVALWNRN